MRDMRNAYKVLNEKSERERPVGRSRHKWRIILK
jgi:hypothetical protein